MRLTPSSSNPIQRRSFLQRSVTATLVGITGLDLLVGRSAAIEKKLKPAVQTVLGRVNPEKLGVTLMHEHAPVVDWSELYETASVPVTKPMIRKTAQLLDAFHKTLAPDEGPGAIVETTPIRVGRDPAILKQLAQQTKVHIIASTGFWCEALAPQHPWAIRLRVQKEGVKQMAGLFIREITAGIEDPHGKWGDRFTTIKAGIIKIGTSTYLRPGERVCHIAAAIASKETGCPITTHTTRGGGLEEAQLLLKHGAKPDKIIIGHQGYQDDRKNDEADEYHRLIANLGCYVQFDKIGHEKFESDKQARQMKKLIDAGFTRQLLVSHDDAPYFYPEFAITKKSSKKWQALDPDYTTVTTEFVDELKKLGTSKTEIRTIFIENPQRVLAF
jgi:predicted metal-dependent phosphotriesterase family hydrolase